MVGGSVLADVVRGEERLVRHFLLHTLSNASELEAEVQGFYFPKQYAGGAAGADGGLKAAHVGKKAVDEGLPVIREEEASYVDQKVADVDMNATGYMTKV
jgi:hypothetical protein